MSTQQFKLSETFSAEVNGRIRSSWLEDFVKAQPLYLVGLGFSKQMMKNKGTLRFTVRDIFHTQIFKGTSKYGNVDVSFQEVNDTRIATLGFTYRFSKGKKITPTKRTSGSATEEQERIGQ